MKLCPHCREIYRNEIKRGNEVVFVSHLNPEDKYATARLSVNFSKPLASYDILGVESKTFVDCHYPTEQIYFCRECKQAVSAPKEENQKNRYTRDEIYDQPIREVIADVDDVYVEDGFYGKFMIPVDKWKGDGAAEEHSSTEYMQLCEHIRPIYANEIKNGNKILFVAIPSPKDEYADSKIKILFSKPIGKYKLRGVTEKITKETPSPPERFYVCKKCSHIASGPISEDQEFFYGLNTMYSNPRKEILFDDQNIYAEKGFYCRYSIPTNKS